MKKITIILIAFVFGIQFNSKSQNVEGIRVGIEKYYKMEKESFLKDFIFNVEPNQEVRYSISLNKGTLYSWYAWLNKKNHLQVSLYDSNDKLLFRNIKSDRGFLRFTTRCTKSQVYHLLIKNISSEPIMTMATLTDAGIFKLQGIDEMRKEIQEEIKDETFLKEFNSHLEPYSKFRSSVVLSKNTLYKFYTFVNNPDDIKINLYDNKENVLFHNKSDQKGVISFSMKCNHTGVYHLHVDNLTDKQQNNIVVLTFAGKFQSKDIEKITPEVTKTETIINTQEGITKEEESTTVYFVVEKMPKYKDKANKIKNFNDFVKQEMQYPQEALNENIEGRVYVQFTVGKNGYVKDAKVARGVHPALDQEALRIVYSSPKWEPGTQKGKAVDVIFTFPINFTIKNK